MTNVRTIEGKILSQKERANLYAKVLRDIKAMTPEEALESFVEAGILTKTHRLSNAYRVLDPSNKRRAIKASKVGG